MATKVTNLQEVFSQLLGSAGTTHVFPLLTKGINPGATGRVRHLQSRTLPWYQDLRNWFWFVEDFLYDAYPSDAPLTIYDASSAGTPTGALVANGTGGQFEMKLAADNELELYGFTNGDQLIINSALPFLLTVRAYVKHTMAANQRVVIGLGSAVDTTTLANLTRRVWFQLEASFALKAELDDNSTDSGLTACNETLTEDTWYDFGILKGLDGTVYYFVVDADGSNFRVLCTLAGGSLSSNLQPLVLIQKDSGTTQPWLLVDRIAYMGARALT